MIKKSVVETYRQEALLVYKRHQGGPRNIPSKRAKNISKASVPTRHSYDREASFLEENAERSWISTSARTSYDISLLGPGESYPSVALNATSVSLQTGVPVSCSPSQTDAGRNMKKVRHSGLTRSTKSQATLERIRNPEVRNSHIAKDDSRSNPFDPSSRLNKFERIAFIEGPANWKTQAEIKDGNSKMCKTGKRGSLVELSAPVAIPRYMEHGSSASGAVNHVPSRCSTTEGSCSLSPELESSTSSEMPKTSGGNDSEYNRSQRRAYEEVSVKDFGGQLGTLTQSSDPTLTESCYASSYFHPTLSPVSVECEPREKPHISQSTPQRLFTRHVGTPLELIDAGGNQAGGAGEDALGVNEYATVENSYSSNGPREKDVVHYVDRRQLLNSQNFQKSAEEEDTVDLRIGTIPRTTALRGQALGSRKSNDESNWDAKQPSQLDNSYRLESHLTRLHTHPPLQGFHRSTNRFADSLRVQTSSQTRHAPLTLEDRLSAASANARSSQNRRQGA